MELMQQYINEQAAILQKMIDGRKELTGEFVEAFRDEPIERIVLFGSGSSSHALLMAQEFMSQALKVEVTAAAPTRMPDTRFWKEQHILYIAVSQGGRSTNTWHLINQYKDAGHKTVSITEDKTSPIAQISDVTLELPIGPEDLGPKTKGVTASAMMLMLMGLELGLARGTADAEFAERSLKSLCFIAAHYQANVDKTLAWVEANAEDMVRSTYMMFLSNTPNRGASDESALKLLETIYRPVFSYEFEEYLHGVQNSLDEKSYLFFLMPDDAAARARWQKTISFARDMGAKCYAIYGGDAISECVPYDLHLDTCGDLLFSSLEFVIPAQVMSAQLPPKCGIDLTQPKFENFIKMTATKLE